MKEDTESLPAPRASEVSPNGEAGPESADLFTHRQIGIRLRNTVIMAMRAETGDISKDTRRASVLAELTMWLGVDLKEIFKKVLDMEELDQVSYDFMICLCTATALYLFREAYGPELVKVEQKQEDKPVELPVARPKQLKLPFRRKKNVG